MASPGQLSWIEDLLGRCSVSAEEVAVLADRPAWARPSELSVPEASPLIEWLLARTRGDVVRSAPCECGSLPVLRAGVYVCQNPVCDGYQQVCSAAA